MKKEIVKADYFRLIRAERNLYSVETVTTENGKIVEVVTDEPTFLPIAFDKLRRRCGEAFFAAVQENL